MAAAVLSAATTPPVVPDAPPAPTELQTIEQRSAWLPPEQAARVLELAPLSGEGKRMIGLLRSALSCGNGSSGGGAAADGWVEPLLHLIVLYAGGEEGGCFAFHDAVAPLASAFEELMAPRLSHTPVPGMWPPRTPPQQQLYYQVGASLSVRFDWYPPDGSSGHRYRPVSPTYWLAEFDRAANYVGNWWRSCYPMSTTVYDAAKANGYRYQPSDARFDALHAHRVALKGVRTALAALLLRAKELDLFVGARTAPHVTDLCLQPRREPRDQPPTSLASAVAAAQELAAAEAAAESLRKAKQRAEDEVDTSSRSIGATIAALTAAAAAAAGQSNAKKKPTQEGAAAAQKPPPRPPPSRRALPSSTCVIAPPLVVTNHGTNATPCAMAPLSQSEWRIQCAWVPLAGLRLHFAQVAEQPEHLRQTPPAADARTSSSSYNNHNQDLR